MLTTQLDTHGFVILDRIISDDECSALAETLQKIASHETVIQRRDVTYGIRNLLNVAPGIGDLAQSPDIRTIVDSIAGPGARVVRAIFFDKTPEANWKVAWHQDLTIAVQERKEVEGFTSWSVKSRIHHTQAPAKILESILTMRIHLDATDESNGALKVIVGSHKCGRLDAEAIRSMKEKEAIVLCNVPKGGALLMRPLLVHASSAGVSPIHRRVIHLEFSANKLPGGLEWFGS